VTHWQFLGWPDHEVPLPEAEECFEKILDKFSTHLEDPSNGRVVVHCSAGIGRTGTTIAINEIRNIVKSQYLNKEEEQ
jgi:protein tyrosine phosphatase